MASKAKKRRRRVLGASCILAALIVAGSSFAWFTSKDEVVNRLSANAEYEMAIAETFQPPKTWVPGQEIGKDVAVVNTGNVDAFTRVYLTGEMRMLKQSITSANTHATYTTDVASLTNVDDEDLINMGITRYDSINNIYFKTLNKKQTINPKEQRGTDKNGFAANVSGPYSEVQAMQSGILAYAPENANYSYVLKEETKLNIAFKDGASAGNIGYDTVTVPAGTLVKVVSSDPENAKGAEINTDGSLKTNDTVAANGLTSASGSKNSAAYNVVYVKSEATFGKPKDIEFESFIPETDGVYLFLRTDYKVDTGTTPEFSGYKVTGTTKNDASGATFYALNTNTGRNNLSDNTIKGKVDADADYNNPVRVTTGNDGVINKVELSNNLELFNASYSNITDDNLKFVYDGTAGSEKLYAFYDADTNDGNYFKDGTDVAVEIALANIGSGGQTWSAKGTGTGSNNTYKLNDNTGADVFKGMTVNKLTFYYNDDVESGDSTAKLVDKVTLLKEVTNKAYLTFDFDLKVNMDSVQVTFDESGNEKTTPVESGGEWSADGAKTTGSTATNQTATEIKDIVWS